MEEMDLNVPSDAAESSNDSSNDSSNAVETLVAGRQRRVNAGNRMSALVQEEEDQQDEADEVTLLFAEAEDEVDEDFNSDEAEEGDNEFSSSDDEDEGQNAGDELEGEKALQRQEKAEKARKRKAELALTSGAALRKKVRIDLSVPSSLSQQKKPSKKKEKLSRLPTDGSNVRHSTRKHTQIQTNTTIAKLQDEEARMAKARKQREKKEREKQQEEPQPEVTQADRLAEATRIERRNLKSLNRWEESEKKRAEEQAAKLAALKDRSLSGPVVSWWSGKAEWVGPRLSMVGNKELTQVQRSSTATDEPKKRGRKPKSFLEQPAFVKDIDAGTSSLGTPQERSPTPAPSESQAVPTPDIVDGSVPDLQADTSAAVQTQQATDPTQTFQGNQFSQGIQEYASTQGQLPPLSMQSLPHLAAAPDAQEVADPIVPAAPLIIENSTRNLVILDKFEDLSSDGRKDFQFFYNKKSAKLAKPDRELCAITSNPAKYRDPSTGIPYANSSAFKKLQELKKHQYTWSSMLDCFVGKTGVVARGVPEAFLGAGVPMRDIQGDIYVRPQPFQVPQPPPPPPPPQHPQSLVLT